jgi:hypothetical protein
MGRRKRRVKAPPESTDGRSYPPWQPNYWFHGGPYIPPDQIQPEPGDAAPKPGDIRPHETPATRLASVTRMLDDARRDLADELARYVGLHERGAEALRWDWQRDAMANANPTLPDEVQKDLAWTYRHIARLRQVIPVYQQVVDGLDSHTSPLFHWRKKG